MLYKDLVDVYQKLESTSKKLEKRDILADFYKKTPEKDLYRVVLLSMGTIYPTGDYDLGIAKEMIKKVIAKTFGVSEKVLLDQFKAKGDLGLVSEHFAENKKQSSLLSKKLDIDLVFDNLRKLPEISGHGSQERKMDLVAELLSSASPKEARYIVRTTIGDMRIGVAAGIIRDAISIAFGKDKKDIERCYDVLGDYGRVAELAKKGRLKAEIEIGRPLRFMLAERAPGLKEAVEKFEKPALQWKVDGFRVQIHKIGNDVHLFSRRLDEVTRQFPDIVQMARTNLKAKNVIVEGEVVAVDKNFNPLPFQNLSRRIQRKYDIEKMIKDIPVQVNLFDLVYFNDKDWKEKSFSERWGKLKSVVKEDRKFRLIDHIETNNLKMAEKFYKKSLAAGQEGIMVKNLDAIYQPGKRVGFWLKIKSIMDPLDLVIVGAEWGEGKRARWLGSLILAARSGEKFLETGRMASGLTEEQMEELTKKLKELIVEENGKIVKLKPEVVIEIGYEEIQKSPKYPSGYALRFPRLLRLRQDRLPNDCSTLKEIHKLYELQRKRSTKPS